MFKKFILFIFLLTIMLSSCTTDERIPPQKIKPRIFPEYNIVLDEIIRSKDGVIRGVDLNSPASIINQVETEKPTEVSSNFLYFEYRIDSIINYSVSYNLINDSLDEVEVQINCSDLDLSSVIFCDLQTYYEKKLPNPTEIPGYVVYNCFEGQRKPFVVSLIDNSSPVKGIINLVIYKDK